MQHRQCYIIKLFCFVVFSASQPKMSIYVLYREQPGARPKARAAAAIVRSRAWIDRWLVCSLYFLNLTEVVTKFFLFESLWSWNLDTRSSSVFDVFCWSQFWKLATIDRVRYCETTNFLCPKRTNSGNLSAVIGQAKNRFCFKKE